MLDDIKRIICQYVDVEEHEIMEQTNFIEDLGLNSYDLMSMIGALEEEFSITIPDRDVPTLITVNDLIEYLARKAS